MNPRADLDRGFMVIPRVMPRGWRKKGLAGLANPLSFLERETGFEPATFSTCRHTAEAVWQRRECSCGCF